MKKILYFITQSEFGGAQRYVFDLANNLKTEFQVAVAMGESINNLKLAKILQKNNIKYFIIPHLKRSISPLNEILALREITKLIKQYQPDIIHLNSSKISILGSIAALFVNSKFKIQNSKFVYTVHGWVFNEPLPAWLKHFYKYAEKFTAGFKDKIICVSEYDKQTALNNKIAPTEKLIAIHNGLAPIIFYSREEAKKIVYSVIPATEPESSVSRSEQISGLRVTAPATLRRACLASKALRAGLRGGREPAMTNSLLIGSIGNLYKTKGFEYFIEAASILMADPSFLRKQESRFFIIGEGSERKNLESLIKKYNLKNSFILAGRIDEAAKLLPAFDIYACSSLKEGLPYSILEAMAASLPIISTKVGGIPEIIEHEKTGLLVKPADAKDLAEKIKLLIDDKTLRQELGALAQAKVKTEFSLERMVRATKKIYKEV